jgi:hypothetical protein
MENTINYKGFEISIEYSQDHHSPDDWDLLGKFYHWHRRYSLSDAAENIKNWDDDEIKELLKNSIYVPVYMYDHSGITINTTGFSCPWDSGQIGYYLVSKEDVKKEYGRKIISKKLKETVIDVLNNEIKIWDDYFTGNIFAFFIKDEDGEILDCCSGYYGEEGAEQALVEAKGMVDYIHERKHMPDRNQLEMFEDVA